MFNCHPCIDGNHGKCQDPYWIFGDEKSWVCCCIELAAAKVPFDLPEQRPDPVDRTAEL
jgi:hypothetical protein